MFWAVDTMDLAIMGQQIELDSPGAQTTKKMCLSFYKHKTLSLLIDLKQNTV